jgi:cytochrome c oxidase subunit 2
MTTPRRSGPTPALVVGVSGIAAILVFLGVLALRGDVIPQLQNVWASFFPPPATTAEGEKIRNLYDIVFAIAAVIFLLVEGLILWAVVRYRRRPTDTELPPQIHGNNLLEVTWTLIPALTAAFLFFVSWQTLNDVDRTDASSPVQIRAVAARFQWTFQYLDQTGQNVQFEQLAPEMVVPAGEKVELKLASKDVIHAFYVPQFLFKRDVVPGRENVFDFTVDPADVGQTFRGQCAELCGEGHWVMQFTVKAVSPTEYQTWVAEQLEQSKQTPPPPASPGASGTTGGSAATVEVSAKNIAFEQQALSAPAGQAFTLAFTNDAAGVPHNVQILDANGGSAFKGEIFNGVATKDYSVPALEAGTYKFVCDVHPNMTGELTVK